MVDTATVLSRIDACRAAVVAADQDTGVKDALAALVATGILTPAVEQAGFEAQIHQALSADAGKGVLTALANHATLLLAAAKANILAVKGVAAFGGQPLPGGLNAAFDDDQKGAFLPFTLPSP